MRGRIIILGAALVVGAAAFVILDADRSGTEDLWSRVTAVFRGNAEPAAEPNWGDVATRIGEFTDEERALREVLNPAIEGVPAGDSAATPAEAPAAAPSGEAPKTP